MKEMVYQAKQGKKKYKKKLNRVQKHSILGPQNLGGSSPPPDGSAPA